MRINEITDNPMQEWLNIIEQNCGPYLKEIGGIYKALHPRHRLYRGLSEIIPDDNKMFIVNVRQDRIPMDTPSDTHNVIDDWFESNMPSGIRYRSSSIFCVCSKAVAQTYAVGGNANAVATILPVGDYHYCWSPIYNDLFRKIGRNKLSRERIEQIIVDGNYKEDTNLVAAIDSTHEIMLHCKQALVIRSDLTTELYGSVRP